MSAVLKAPRRHDVFRRLTERDGWTCWLCLEAIDPDAPQNHERAASIDHVKPRSQGGRNHLGNLRLAHRGCNAARGDRRVSPEARI